MTCILVTGIAGFIGANLVLDWPAVSDEPVVNLDKLSFADNPETLVSRLLVEYRPRLAKTDGESKQDEGSAA